MSISKEGLRCLETSWFSPGGRSFKITFHASVVNNRPEIAQVHVEALGDDWLSQADIRQIPIKKLFDRLIHQEARNEPDFLTRELTVQVKNGHRGQPHRRDELIALAEAYHMIRNQRLPILPTLASRFGLSQSTLNKRLIAARREGLLPSWRLRDGKQVPSPRSRRNNDPSTTNRQGSRTAARSRPHKNS